MNECICNESDEEGTSELEEMEQGGSEGGDSNLSEPEEVDGSGVGQERAAVGARPEPALHSEAAVGVRPEPAGKTRAAVGVRPEPAEKTREAVGVRPEPACMDKAAVGVGPEPAETGTGSAEAGLDPSIFAVPESTRPPRAGRSRAEPPALARPGAKPGGAAEEEEKMEEDDDEPLPSAQVARKELKRAGGGSGGVPGTPEAEGGALDSSGSEMDMGQVVKVRKSLSRCRKKGKVN
ncbi:uncharacterized protein V6R79_025413 [Siganus canaliculatus]